MVPTMEDKITVKPAFGNTFTDVRLIYNPLWEAVMSYRILRDPSSHIYFQRWVDEAQSALNGLDLPLMESLILPVINYVPDFLTPTPRSTDDGIDVELARLEMLDEDQFRKDLSMLALHFGTTRQDVMAFFKALPDSAQQLAGELCTYWELALSQHWGDIAAVLEGDLLYRGRQLATAGKEHVLSGIDGGIHMEDGNLEMQRELKLPIRHDYRNVVFDSVILTPMVFSWPHWYFMDGGNNSLVISYAARGHGLWSAGSSSADDALDVAFGASRADVIRTLTHPMSNSELATRLHVTPGAVSQQLSRLNQAGLVSSQRVGKYVFYSLSHRGQQVLNLFYD